jgi:single-strand DNA-binding protein
MSSTLARELLLPAPEVTAMSLNKILLIGNLGKDPEVRYMPSGKAVVSFNLATNRRYKVEGELREETEWFRIVTFGRLAEICSEFLKKGRSVFVEGRIRTNTWTDNEGAKHYRTEVIAEGLTLIGRRNGNGSDAAAPDASDEEHPF